MALTIVTIRGRFSKPLAEEPPTDPLVDPPDLVPAKGSVSFVLSTALQDPASNDIVSPVRISIRLDETGSFVTKLVATDDAGVEPEGATYLVTESIRGANARSYNINIPHTATDLDLADLVPVTAVPPTFGYALQSALSAEETTRAQGDADTLSAAETHADDGDTAHAASSTAHPASHVTVGAGAGVVATDVQAALAEVTGFITSQEAGDSAAVSAIAAGLADEISRAIAAETIEANTRAGQVAARVRWMGEFNPGLAYNPNDVVTHDTGVYLQPNPLPPGAWNGTGWIELVPPAVATEGYADTGDALRIPLTQKGAPSGVASLDGSGLVPDAQIPAGIARDTEVAAAVAALVASAPGTLDTLNELATALGDDPNFATTIATTLAGKQPLDADLTTIAALDSTTAGALVTDGAGWIRKSYSQLKTALGLGNVDNTSDANKPVSTAQAAADAATLSSAQTFATGAVGTEASRAMTAEATKLVAGSTSTYANLAALPAASAHTNEIVKTLDAGVYESTGSAWVQLVPPSGTYALIDDSAYDATTWDGDTTHSPSKNAIRDKIETLGSGGGLSLSPTAVKTAAYTAAPSDLVPVDTTAGAVTITLPAAPADKSVIVVKHVIQGGTNTVTVARGGSDVFNKAGGSTSLTLTLVNQALLVQYKASTGIWYVIADDLALSQLDGRYVTYVGSATAPITNPAQARPSTSGPVYWVMDVGIVPANAIDGDMIWTKNGPTTITSDGTVAKIVKLTQAAYNALSPDSATMYWIVG